MKHLITYNESAGKGWREVSREEMARMVDGQSIDTFTRAEADHLFDFLSDLAADRVLPNKICLYEIRYPGSQMRRGMLFYSGDERVIRATDTFFKPTNDPRSRSLANCLQFVYGRVIGKILRSPDDYIYVRLLDSMSLNRDYYVCDGLSALKDLISEKVIGAVQ